MRNLLIATLLLGTPLFGSIQGKVHDFPTFLKKLVSSVEDGEKSALSAQALKQRPEWKQAYRRVDENSSAHTWRAGREELSIDTFCATSEQEAAEKMEQALLGLSIRILRKEPEPELAGIADDVYSHGSTIYFRKANILVHIGATSPELAKKYARRIAALITDK